MGKRQHPVQPVEKDERGVFRFKENKIVTYLLEAGPFDMNELARKDFSREDREQFAQLIGHSVSGFSDLPYATDRVYSEASAQIPDSDDGDERTVVRYVMSDCFDCPLFGRRPIGGKWVCNHVDNRQDLNMINNPFHIPDWCPLPREE